MRLTPVGASSQTSGSAAGAVTAWYEPRFLLTSHTIPSCSPPREVQKQLGNGFLKPEEPFLGGPEHCAAHLGHVWTAPVQHIKHSPAVGFPDRISSRARKRRRNTRNARPVNDYGP